MKKVLVYDLDADFRDQIKMALISLGYETLISSDGYGVLPLAEANRPDLILLDYKLPDAAGVDILKRLRVSPKCGSTPVIFVSETPKFEIEMSVMDTAAVGYADKPLDIAQLKEAIESLIGPNKPAPKPVAAKPALAAAVQPQKPNPPSAAPSAFSGEADLDGTRDDVINLD